MVKIMENPIKMDDLGVPLFLETPIFIDFLSDRPVLIFSLGDGSMHVVFAIL